MEVGALSCGGDGVAEWGLGEGRVSEERDELVRSALAEAGSDIRNAKYESLEVSGIWRRGRREEWKGASAVDDDDGFLRVKGGSPLVVVEAVLVEKRDALESCIGRD